MAYQARSTKGKNKITNTKRRRKRRSADASHPGAKASRSTGESAIRRRESKSSSTVSGLKRARFRLEMEPGLKNFVARSARLSKMVQSLEKSVTFTVAPRTVSGESIQSHRGRLHKRDIDDFRGHPDAVEGAARQLEQLGFNVIHRGRFGITARGPAKLVSDLLDIELAVNARPRRTPLRATQNFAVSYEPPVPEDLYVAPVDSLTVGSRMSDHIDHFVFTPPPRYFAPPSPVEASHGYFGIDSAAIRRLLNVPAGATGAGVKIAIIDTGFYRHPYYASNNLDYRPTPTSSAPDPESDAVGHGTAMAYSLFAVAPGATVMGVKLSDPPQDAVEQAANAGADIISCSWGWDGEELQPQLELMLRHVVNDGKIVLFASGDGAQAWPASMREVLSVGGVYADQGNQLEASNMASGFTSSRYPGRNVPDVCGLCGQKPKGIYIMMPCPPGSGLDMTFAGASFPDRDETAPDDGWVGTSGTSSSVQQVAGVVALMIEKARADGTTLTTDSVRDLLQRTAISVEKGRNAQGILAEGHPNLAVGFGLVDAGAALAML